MFALRNKGGSDCVQALGDAFASESALLKHEVAYVLGQMQDANAVNTLRCDHAQTMVIVPSAVACTRSYCRQVCKLCMPTDMFFWWEVTQRTVVLLLHSVCRPVCLMRHPTFQFQLGKCPTAFSSSMI